MLQAWRRHEYVTIAASTLSMHLAEIALSAETRQRLLARNRRLMREGWARLQRWVDSSGGLLSVIPPAATALGFVRYHLDAPSIEVRHYSTQHHEMQAKGVLQNIACPNPNRTAERKARYSTSKQQHF